MATSKRIKRDISVAATPYAVLLADEHRLSLSDIPAKGPKGEIKAIDVLSYLEAEPKATPLARAKAEAFHIDLKETKGSGYRGKIFSYDLPTKEETKKDDVDLLIDEIDSLLERVKMSGMRRVIAERMLKSHTEIPTVTQNISVDVTELFELREKINEGLEKKDSISVNDFMVRAVALAVKEHERFRMTISGGEYVLHEEVNVGVAVGTDDGLLVPCVRHADRKSLSTLSKELKILAQKAREGKLEPQDMGDARITVSNLGMYDVSGFTPIINQPEASIVGICSAEVVPVFIDGSFVPRKKITVCLTYDHRILNGTEAASFEMRLKQLVENPMILLI